MYAYPFSSSVISWTTTFTLSHFVLTHSRLQGYVSLEFLGQSPLFNPVGFACLFILSCLLGICGCQINVPFFVPFSCQATLTIRNTCLMLSGQQIDCCDMLWEDIRSASYHTVLYRHLNVVGLGLLCQTPSNYRNSMYKCMYMYVPVTLGIRFHSSFHVSLGNLLEHCLPPHSRTPSQIHAHNHNLPLLSSRSTQLATTFVRVLVTDCKGTKLRDVWNQVIVVHNSQKS